MLEYYVKHFELLALYISSKISIREYSILYTAEITTSADNYPYELKYILQDVDSILSDIPDTFTTEINQLLDISLTNLYVAISYYIHKYEIRSITDLWVDSVSLIQTKPSIHTAVLKGDIDTVMKMLSENGDIVSEYDDKDGFPPIIKAAKQNDISMVDLLIKYCADINSTSAHGTSNPLIESSADGLYEMVEYLLKHGANVKLTNTLLGMNALHIAAFHNRLQVCIVLLKYGMDINSIDNRGMTPLAIAIEMGNTLIAQLLIGLGANINTVDDRDRTLLDIAQSTDNYSLIHYLKYSMA